jgi:hypothetical protein
MSQLPMRILAAAAAAVPTTASGGNNVITVPIVADTITITVTSNRLQHITVLRLLLRVSLLILRVML